jgi:hypothetical protein
VYLPVGVDEVMPMPGTYFIVRQPPRSTTHSARDDEAAEAHLLIRQTTVAAVRAKPT